MRALNGRESTLSNWLDNESEKFREMRVLAGPTLKTVICIGRQVVDILTRASTILSDPFDGEE
eukprot:scaffold26070_cov71-Cyclotella_meneghiniana.AAC.7